MLLQPFLSRVTQLGEMCVVFINGKLLHVVWKDPSSWGASADESAAADTGRARHHPSTQQTVRRILKRAVSSARLLIRTCVRLGASVVGSTCRLGLPCLGCT